MVSLWCAPKHVIDEGYVEVELAGVFGLELACLKFDYRTAWLFDVEEEPVYVVVIPVDVEVELSADEGQAGALPRRVSVILLARAFSRSRSATSPEGPRNSKL
jgi:hypothetical protein